MVEPINQRLSKELSVLFTYYLRYGYDPRFKVFIDSHNPTNSFHLSKLIVVVKGRTAIAY